MIEKGEREREEVVKLFEIKMFKQTLTRGLKIKEKETFYNFTNSDFRIIKKKYILKSQKIKKQQKKERDTNFFRFFLDCCLVGL